MYNSHYVPYLVLRLSSLRSEVKVAPCVGAFNDLWTPHEGDVIQALLRVCVI